MGCICSKVSADEYTIDDSSKIANSLRKQLPELKISRVSCSEMNEKIWEKDRLNCGDVTVMLFDKKANCSIRSHSEINDRKKTEIPDVTIFNHPCMGKIPKVAEAEQVAAGWPSWLAVVAGEAINGWLPKRANNFVKIDKIGQGTYSSVYKARDIAQDKIVALKRVRFDNQDKESIKFMAREILVLRRLNHPNIVKLEGLITSQASCTLYLVFEYMEHDLTGLASRPGAKFTEPQVKCYMKQLLSGLDHCHSHGVLHRDIKGSNLLIDNNGILKIADFGLAVFFDPKSTNPMTSRVVTLWYRPPELLLGSSQYGTAVDLWSTGCILGELYAGRPILPGKTEVEQLHKIFRLCGSPSKEYLNELKLKCSSSTAIKPSESYGRCLRETFQDFPPATVQLMDTLLSIDPAERGTAASALNTEFFTSSPFPCDPSKLPKYPPSKEIDSKRREELARREVGVHGRSCIIGPEARKPKHSGVIPAAKADVDLVISLLKKQSQPGSKCRNEAFPHRRSEAASFLTVDSIKAIQVPKYERKSPKRTSKSGPLTHEPRLEKPRKETKNALEIFSNYLISPDSIRVETYKDLQQSNAVPEPDSLSQDRNH